jgi:predicted Zn-dependent protease
MCVVQRSSTRCHKMLLALIVSSSVLFGCATSTKPGAVGVTRPQLMLVSASTVEKMASVSYVQQFNSAKTSGKLIQSGPQYDRVLAIAKNLRGQVTVFRDDVKDWKWGLTLIDSPTINANCAPGGKITFYTGLIDKLQLTDDEIAMVMGHEIAHALREHGRERVSQAVAQNAITQVALATTQNKVGEIALANQFAKYLFVLPNSRQNETEADKIGLELAARAGYDPHAAITVWQKMTAVESSNVQPEFLSTHPSNSNRINELGSMMPAVLPFYKPRVE